MSQPSYDPEVVTIFQQQFVETYILNALTVMIAFSAMRIYALWDCNIPLALIVVILNLAPVVTNIYDFSIATPAYSLDPIFGAFCSLPIPSTRLFSFTYVIQPVWTEQIANRAGVDNVFEQLTPATLFFSTSARHIRPVDDIIDLFSNSSLTPILISRFLLNLRELRPSENGGESLGNFSQFSVSGFRVPSNILVGNLGGNLADDTGDENTTTDDSGEGRASSGSEGGSNDSSDVIPTEESRETVENALPIYSKSDI
ncbi:hypothetical protein PHLCEN_2v12913 [Hermanssonia centrifuga]|uniref:Uncharacterized protein n=1 Tax=Hermanssonia centrifuga TaxID=98765 RepID=A0A2R6NG30_9APHY|nr:hypothetical protein PHLCEN_2v12913 [Hermanssonia centrifuga]